MKATLAAWVDEFDGDRAAASVLLDAADGRWIAMPEDDLPTGPCDFDGLVRDNLDVPPTLGSTAVELGRERERDGVPTVELEIVFESIGQRSTLIVGHIDGRHLLLEADPFAGGEAVFGQFDEPVEVEAPPAEETVDVEDLPDRP